MDNSTFEKEIKKTFLDETEEMLNESEKLFLQLEKDQSLNYNMPKILRIMHTIKGSSAAVELLELTNFIHKFESVLIAIKDGVLELNSNNLNLIFLALDTVKLYINQVRDNDLSLDLFTEISIKFDLLLNKNPIFHSSNDLSNSNSIKNEIAIKNEINFKRESLSKKETAKKGTVLVCDDEVDILNYLERIIVKSHYEVIKCLNPLNAIKMLDLYSIDVIVTDLKMPQLSGHELSLQIRKLNQYIPIILISGNITKEDKLKFVDIGVIDVIHKPFKSKEICAVLDRCIQIKTLWEELINVSKTSFKIYVGLKNIFEKYKHDEEVLKIEEYLEFMQNSTIKLLKFEKWIKKQYYKEKNNEKNKI